MPFGQLFAEVTNETTASGTIVGEVLLDLAASGTLLVQGERGGRRRVHDRIGARDLVKPSRQLFIFPGSR